MTTPHTEPRKPRPLLGLFFLLLPVGVVFWTFVILKLCGQLDWGWLWVWSPIWGVGILLTVLMFGTLLIAFCKGLRIGMARDRWQHPPSSNN